MTDGDTPEVSTRMIVHSSMRLDPSSSLTLWWNWGTLMMTRRTRAAKTASTGSKARRSFWRETSRARERHS